MKSLDGPELVFGLIGPIGTDLDLVCAVLSEELLKVNYKSNVIRISSLIPSIDKYKNLSKLGGNDEGKRIKEYMKAGTQLRKKTGRGDILALLVVSNMREQREDENRSSGLGPDDPLHRTAYVLRSLKHPKEIETLRDIYGRAFIVISAYSPREKRVEVLSQLIAKSKHCSDSSNYRSVAEQLINIDEEEGSDLGQDVRDAFPLADLFVDARSRANIERSISRFIELLFGYPYHTPSRDEFGMFHARSAALRSADLSRQVGSVITSIAFH